MVAFAIGGTAAILVFWCIYSAKSYQSLAITIFFFIIYCFFTLGNSQDPQGYTTDPFDAFHMAHGLCFLDQLILSRIPNMKQKCIYRIASTLATVILIPPTTKTLFIMHSVHVIGAVYLDFQADKHSKTLFRSYFNYKNQLIKFKDLVVKDIPESIIILTQDLQNCLFLNNSFHQVFGTSTNLQVWSILRDFLLKDDLQSAKNNDIDSHKPQTHRFFPQFLSKAVHSWAFDHSQDKLSCNLTYSQPLRSQDGSEQTHTFETTVIHIVWDEQPAIAVVLHDITEQHTILSLKLADAQKDALLATVSHELRTPLNGMLGMIQIMQKRTQEKELLQYLEICKNSGKLLLSLVNSILDLNQIRASTIKLLAEQVPIEEFLTDIAHLFQIQCSTKNLYLQFQVARNTDKFIFTDRNRLSQILINLVGNALKFTQKGGIKIQVQPSSTRPEYLEFRVIDTGIGIKDEDKFKLFRMFGKLEQANTRVNHEGVGLGLTISNTLVRLLCNNSDISGIKLESTYGKGSKFSFFVLKNLQRKPLEKLTENPSIFFEELGDIQKKISSHCFPNTKLLELVEKSNSAVASLISLDPNKFTMENSSLPKTQNCLPNIKLRTFSGTPMERLTSISSYILIVDDNPLNLIVAERLISLQGCRVKTALSAESAIEAIVNNDHKKEPIKLILMDLQMPGIDGYEATRNLRNLANEGKIPKIPVVALTANDSEADREACTNEGMAGYVTKPLKETDLVVILKKFL